MEFVDKGDAGDVIVNTKECSKATRDSSPIFGQPSVFALSIQVVQLILMSEDIATKVDELADKNANSVDSEIRYMAYGARLRTALRASTRYVAYVWVFLPLSFVESDLFYL